MISGWLALWITTWDASISETRVLEPLDNTAISLGKTPKVAKVQVHAKGDGIRPKPNADQIPLPLKR
jgi:hypothetical protein